MLSPRFFSALICRKSCFESFVTFSGAQFRYHCSAIATSTATKSPFVIVNIFNPGLCYTNIARIAEGRTKVIMKVMRAALAWTAKGGELNTRACCYYW